MLITEISENDFRKLNLKVYRHERVVLPGHPVFQFKMVEKNINDILDEQINYVLDSGYPSDLSDLKCPVTIAIHKPYTEEELIECKKEFPDWTDEESRDMCLNINSYFDKFMNRFTGAQTYQMGWGIKHLYSTRDYYEDHEDYWRVKKKDTLVIYRVHLNERPFVLKHNTIQNEWPYDFLPDGASPDYKSISLDINYDLQDDGSWKEVSRCCNIRYEHCSHIIPVDEHGNKKL